MIISKSIEIPLHPKTIKYYESLGYEIPRFPSKYNKSILSTPNGTKIVIKIEDLPLMSNLKVEYQCDYCGEKDWKTYCNLTISRDIIPKDCCVKCTPLKTKEVNLIKYGVKHTSELETNKQKRRETNLKIYGSEYAVQNKNVKEKMKNTFLENYGETTPAKNQEVKNKMAQTNMERYGAISPTLNEEVRAKQIETLKNNYGVAFPQQSEEIKKLSMKSLYENNTAPCSRQQRYIHNLLGGKLNFPHHNSFLDICFVDEKIYLEIDLGGHELQMKLGNVTEEEYRNNERKRWYALYRKGWKEIRIISTKDKIPSDDKLIEIMNYAREYLNTGRHYIKFYLDEGKVKTSQFEEDYDFGELRYIYKKNIETTINNAI